jgi:hypothetical protein
MTKAFLRSLLVVLTGLVVTMPVFSQVWENPPQNGWYYIKSVQAGKENAGFWDQPGHNNRFEKGDNLMVYSQDTETFDQRFKFIEADDGYFFIVSKNGGFIDVAKGGGKNGTNVGIWEGHKRDNQRFRFKYLGNGRWKIYAKTGGILSLEGKSHKDRSNIQIWTDYIGPSSEWILIDASNGQTVTINDAPPELKEGARGQVTAQDYDNNGKSTRVESGKTKVEVWIFNPDDKGDPYLLSEIIETDNLGRFLVPSKYMAESSLMLLAHRDNRSSGMAVLRPKSGQTSMSGLTLDRYTTAEYVLVPTMYRGKQWYKYQDGYFYRVNGIVTRWDDFFFPEINNRSPVVKEFLAEVFPGLDLGQAKSDQEIVIKFNAVFRFLDSKTKSAMGGDDQLATEASAYLFRNCTKSPESPVSRWPTLQEYAETWKKFGFLPSGNCTSWSQMTATLLYAVGVPPDRFCVSKFHYDPSWRFEHWVIGLNLNGRWFNIDPQHARVVRPNRPEDFDMHYWETYVKKTYDYTKPFEVFVLPGSNLNQVPYMGDPAELMALNEEAFKPSFFKEKAQLTFKSQGLVSSSKGKATVLRIKGNRVTVQVEAITTSDGVKGKEETKEDFTMEITYTNGTYSYIPVPGVAYIGRVSSDGSSLTLDGDQSGMTFHQ